MFLSIWFSSANSLPSQLPPRANPFVHNPDPFKVTHRAGTKLSVVKGVQSRGPGIVSRESDGLTRELEQQIVLLPREHPRANFAEYSSSWLDPGSQLSRARTSLTAPTLQVLLALPSPSSPPLDVCIAPRASSTTSGIHHPLLDSPSIAATAHHPSHHTTPFTVCACGPRLSLLIASPIFAAPPPFTPSPIPPHPLLYQHRPLAPLPHLNP
ncbi:hypothetical protein CERSUDRAFT_99593 [Gelatoporia subvermispora B]|uniref:Uncharacterized protein n=1 Tax=Ceriporiopsis subvermispora (strain B) TaxID=914234 RepID=M2Q5U2_CERS8|nr:hypothetical protein CERSUDRAFT_99593 [Gelatoporia subvermispora B]